MNKIFLLLITSLLYNAIFCENKQLNPHIITFFIKPLDEIREKELEREAVGNKIKNISQAKEFAQYFNDIISELHNDISRYYNFEYWRSGIYSVYSGYATYSTGSGQITFPRKNVRPRFNLLLTRDIKPVFKRPDNPNNISGFVLSENAKFKYYSLERVENVEEKLYSWHINEKTILKNRLIPHDAIIIFVNPENFFVPIGQIHALEGENLILPDIYFINKLSKQVSAFKFFKIIQYFSPIITKFEFKPEVYQQRIEN